jgi:hypothetical protein
MQDPQLGRMWQLDPHADSYYFESPFTYGANNPISFIDPDGRDRIRKTNTTYELEDGSSLTFTTTRKVSNELQKQAVYDSDGNITGYDWYDINEIRSITYNSKGEEIGNGALYSNGAKRASTSIDNESWAILKSAFSGGESFREGSGVSLTSKTGEGGGPKSRYADADPVSIDGMVAALSIAGSALNQGSPESLLGKLEYVKESFKNFVSTQDGGLNPFTIDMNRFKSAGVGTKICNGCKDNVYHYGIPSLLIKANGQIDTIRPGPSGGTDTVPAIKPPKRN